MSASAAPTTESSEDILPPLAPSVNQFVQSGLRGLAKATAASNTLPNEEKNDWDFYSSFQTFRQVMRAENASVADMMQRLLQWNGIRGRVATESQHAGAEDASASASAGHVTDLMELLTEANDTLLERINTHLDEAAGLKKDVDPLLVQVASTQATPNANTSSSPLISGSWNRNGSGKRASSGTPGTPTSKSLKLLTAKNIVRPQMKFKDLVDNTSAHPFQPRLRHKPHAKKPLSILVEYSPDGTQEYFSHPYLYELDTFRPSTKQMNPEDELVDFLNLDQADFVYVDTLPQLQDMVERLKRESVIAVDLEHHWYRSYQGITSLVQISSPDVDFVVDPFPLWRDLTLLNEVFADPAIVKVLHGAVNDVLWLQRDFSVYIVNMFDTYEAAKLLATFPQGRRGFASLLWHYCQVRTDKQFQIADWRMRPLPAEMLRYARTDTRYLIYIYRRMKNALIKEGNEYNNLLQSVLDQGSNLCRARYDKPSLTSISHLELMKKSRANFNSRQLHALKELFYWRDKVAREEDESCAYILPNHMLLKICTELPKEMQGILACCNPIPPHVKQNLQHLHLKILQARQQELTTVVEDMETPTSVATFKALLGNNMDVVEDPLKSPLDLAHVSELVGPVLLGEERDNKEASGKFVEEKSLPVVDVFGQESKREADNNGEKVRSFFSPYQRYQMLKPYLQFINAQDQKTSTSSSSSTAASAAMNVTDEQRIQSLKEHFDAMTAMTPEDFLAPAEKKKSDVEAAKEKERKEEEERQKEKERVAEEEKDLAPIMEKLREGKSGDKKRKRQQKQFESKRMKTDSAASNENVNAEDKLSNQTAAVPPKIDYANADMNQFVKKKSAMAAGGNKQFDPWKDFNNSKGKKGGGGKQKQRYKPGGGSMSYKK